MDDLNKIIEQLIKHNKNISDEEIKVVLKSLEKRNKTNKDVHKSLEHLLGNARYGQKLRKGLSLDNSDLDNILEQIGKKIGKRNSI